MYLKHLNQTNRTMNVTIEHVFCRYSDEAEEIYFRIMNTILFATDETELRASMERLKNETSLDEYFIFGYGAHHIWINQRRPSDKNRIFKNRIMVAISDGNGQETSDVLLRAKPELPVSARFFFSRQTCRRNTFFILIIKILIQPGGPFIFSFRCNPFI